MVGKRCQALFVLSLTFGALCSASPRNTAGSLAQRVRPPASLSCSRDHLTSFQWRVFQFTRGTQEVSLVVRTDEETTERFLVRWSPSEKAETWMLLRGEAFTVEDWNQIESAPGTLRADTRVIVWVCDDGPKPVIDWRPKEP